MNKFYEQSRFSGYDNEKDFLNFRAELSEHGFDDSTYNNDVAPSLQFFGQNDFNGTVSVQIFVDYSDWEKRELPSDSGAFTVFINSDDHKGIAEIGLKSKIVLKSDDYMEVIFAAISAKGEVLSRLEELEYLSRNGW